MKKIRLIFTLLVFSFLWFGCGPSTNTTSSNSADSAEYSLRGNWILKEILDSVQLGHTIYMPQNSLFTEVRIGDDRDSFHFDNGDLESWKSFAKKIGRNTYSVPDLCAFPHSAFYFTQTEMHFYDSAAGKEHRYIRIDSSWSDSTHANFELFGLINKVLFQGKYSILGSIQANDIEFTAKQDVSNHPEWASYEFFLNGDMASMSEEPLLSFERKKGKSQLYIYQHHGDTLFLFAAKNTECKDCKPFYERGKELKRLLRLTHP